MEGPTLAALQEVLADLEDLPASEERDKAITKVRKQIEDLQSDSSDEPVSATLVSNETE